MTVAALPKLKRAGVDRGSKPVLRAASNFSAARCARLVLLLHAVGSPLLFCTACQGVFEFPKLSLLLTTAIVLAALGCRYLVAMRPPVLDLLGFGVVLFLASAALSTCTSISPRGSLWGTHESHAGLVTITAYAVLFIATRFWCRSLKDMRLLLGGCVVAAVIAAGCALLQFAQLDPIVWTSVSDIGSYVRPFGTLGHPNFLAAYLVMAVPLLVWFAVGSPISASSPLKKGTGPLRLFENTGETAWPERSCPLFQRAASRLICCGAALTVVLLAIVLTVSRGAWLALAVIALLLLCHYGRQRPSRRRLVLTLMATLVMGGVIVGLCLAEAGGLGTILAGRLREFGASASRVCIWEAGLGMFAERPWLGYGPDTFQLAFGLYQPAEYWHHEWNTTPARAHNELIHVLATQGLVGLAALVTLLAGLVLAFVRAWRAAGDRLLVLCLGAAACGFLVTSLFSYTVVACGTLFVTIAALLSRLAHSGSVARTLETDRVPARWLHLAVWAGAAACVYWGILRPLHANLLAAASDHESQPEQATALLSRALELAPADDVYWAKLGDSLQLAAFSAVIPEMRETLLAKAESALSQACRLEPHSAYHHANLGRLLARRTKANDAFAAFETALRLDRHNAYLLVDAADAALELGELDRASDFAERCRALYPHFAVPQAQLGLVALRQGRYAEAAERLRRALAAGAWYDDDAMAHHCRRQLDFALQKLTEKQNAGPTASLR